MKENFAFTNYCEGCYGKGSKIARKMPVAKNGGGKGSIFFGNTTFDIDRESKINLSPVSSNKITPT